MRDKLDWHASSAVDNGQPEEHGFVHIACFLHWLGLRGWLEPSLFSKADRARIADGSITLDDLIDLTDEQLSRDMATPEGADFGEARYDDYVRRWSEEVPGGETYNAAWTLESRVRATAILDELYDTWTVEGKPRPRPTDRGEMNVHVHPEVERLIPWVVAGFEPKVDSFPAQAFGDVTIDELRAAGVEPDETACVLANHRWGHSAASSFLVTLLILPGIEVGRIERLLAPRAWGLLADVRIERHGDVQVQTGMVGDSHVALWVRDGLAAKVWARRPTLLRAAIGELTEATRGPITVHANAIGREWTGLEEDDRAPHVDPELEALLPTEVVAFRTRRRSEPLGPIREQRLPIAEIGLDPNQSHRATAHGPDGMIIDIISVPGATAEQLAPIAVQVGAPIPELPVTHQLVGDRTVALQKNRGWLTAVWVRDGIICTVQGHISRRLLLEAIARMP